MVHPAVEIPLIVPGVYLVSVGLIEVESKITDNTSVIKHPFEQSSIAQFRPPLDIKIIPSPGPTPRGPSPDKIKFREIIAVLDHVLPKKKIYPSDLTNPAIMSVSLEKLL